MIRVFGKKGTQGPRRTVTKIPQGRQLQDAVAPSAHGRQGRIFHHGQSRSHCGHFSE